MKKETDPMDDFFRESLKNFTVEPSAPARARFLKGASSQAGWSSLLPLEMFQQPSSIKRQ